MTVKELIEELKKYNESKKIVISGFNSEGIYCGLKIGNLLDDDEALLITIGEQINEQ